MIVTGYMLREAIKTWELRADAAASLFNDSMYAFEGEDKKHPTELMARYAEACDNIAKLQTAQAQYNVAVNVGSSSEPMTLCEAVKAVGGVNRREKMWRLQFPTRAPRGNLFFAPVSPTVRNKDSEHAKRAMSQDEIIEHASAAAMEATRLRAAIALGNSTKIEISWLGLYLFE